MPRKMLVIFLLFALILGVTASSALGREGQSTSQPGELQDPAVEPINESNSWTKTVITESNSHSSSLVFDPVNSRPYISYFYKNGSWFTEVDLMLAIPVAAGGNCGINHDWDCLTVDSYTFNGNSSIDFYRDVNHEEISISYHDFYDQGLYFARYSCALGSCVWSISSIISGGSNVKGVDYGGSSSFKYDSQGHAHIAYSAFGGFPHTRNIIEYAHEVASGGNCGKGIAQGKWQCDVIDGEDDGEFAAVPSLDLNGSGEPRIAYLSTSNDHYVLKYASPSVTSGNCGPGNTWQCDVIDDSASVGLGASLHVNKVGPENPVIAYYDYTHQTLRYASPSGVNPNCGPDSMMGVKTWSCVDIVSTSGGGISLAAADDGRNIGITYQGSSDVLQRKTLNLAVPSSSGNCGPQVGGRFTWQCSIIDDASSGSIDGGVSVGVNKDGAVVVAYSQKNDDNTGYRMKYAFPKFTQWFLPLMDTLPLYIVHPTIN